jgi:signal transduction histidine kinase/ActR/RegA family two-component response regulator
LKVLIVEDGALDRAVLVALLRRRGHEITEAETAEQGWEALRRDRFPLLFTDLRLPQMSGLELLERIGTLPEQERPHSVMITASNRPEDLQEALERGAHDYLLKTVGADALDVRVRIAEQAAQFRIERLRGEQLQRVLYRISDAVSSSETLRALFVSIRAAVEELIDARNFYIAMVDPATGALEYPYWVGEPLDGAEAGGQGRGLTEYVLRTGETLIAPPDVQARLRASGDVDACGDRPVHWLGVPLKRRQQCFGVLGIFSYSEHLRIGRDEADVLTFLSEQVATAIERKRAEEALHRSERMAAMGGLVAGVAHEIRNPLFGLTAAIDAFELRYGEGDHEKAGYLERMRTQADRVARLMRDLLEYGKPYEPVLESAPLMPVLEAALDAVRALADERDVILQVEREPEMPEARLDTRRFEHIFVNLLDNAIRHSPRGGTVHVTLSVKHQGTPRIVCAVRDSGEGFRSEVLPRVFEPFFSRRRGGTGLGLAIVQRVAEEHGGAVTVRNANGGGGIVEVSLPLPPGGL